MVLSLLLLFAAPYSIAHELYSQTASLKAISQTASLKAIRSARSRVGGSTPALCASAGRHDASKDASVPSDLGRRAALSRAAAAGVSTLLPGAAQAEITKDSEWPLWLALPVAPYSRRKTIRRAVGPGVWAFEQLLGIYYVHVPIRMTVVSMSSGGLFEKLEEVDPNPILCACFAGNAALMSSVIHAAQRPGGHPLTPMLEFRY